MRSKRLTKGAIVVIVVAFSFALNTNASSPGDVLIKSVGTIGISIIAKSGSAADIQTAVNTFGNVGGTVYIPAGNWTWSATDSVTIPPGVNVIGTGLAGCQGHSANWANYTAQTIIFDTFHKSGTPLFDVEGSDIPQNHKATRISGIEFQSQPPPDAATENAGDMSLTAVYLKQIYNFRVDHCTFINFAGTSVVVTANSGINVSACSYGVVDHCFIYLPYKTTDPISGAWAWGYGVYSIGSGGYQLPTSPGWTYPVISFFGKYGLVPGYTICYVEDCHFRYMRHCTDAINGGWITSRFNLEEYPACSGWISLSDVHGNQPNGWLDGGRGQEVYNCTLKADTSAQRALYPWWHGDCAAINERGGAGLFYNNTYYGNGMPGADSAFVFLSNGDDFPTMAYWANGMDTNQIYIWSNTFTNTHFMYFDYRVSGYNWTQNVNYFLRAPSLALDGFSYTPYTYPHPLTSVNQ